MNLFPVLRRGLTEALTEIGCHDDTVVGGDAEQRQEPDPDRDAHIDGSYLEQIAEVVPEQRDIQKPGLAVQPHENEAAGPSEQNSREHEQRGRDLLELEVQDQPDREKRDRKHDAQLLRRADLVLVAARELVADPRRDVQLARVDLILQKALSLLDHVDLGIAVLLVEDHVADEKRVFALDDLGAAHVLDRRELDQRNLRAVMCRDQRPFDGLDRVS